MRTRARTMSADEAARFKTFVDRSLDELHCGLKLDNGDATSSKGKIAAAFAARKDLKRDRNAAQLVLEGRFLLGADDAAYLASGLGLLWSTVGDKECAARDADADELALAPAALYMPEATNGIRAGLLRALKASHATQQRGDKRETLGGFLKRLKPLLEVEEIKRAVDESGAFAQAIDDVGGGSSATNDAVKAALPALARGLLDLRKALLQRSSGESLATSIMNAQAKQVDGAQRRIDEAKRREQAAAEKAAELGAALSQVQDELTALQAAFDKEEAAREAAETKANKAEAGLTSKAQELKSCEDAKSALTTRAAQIQADLATATENVQARERELRESASAQGALEGQRAEAQAQFETAKTQAAQREQELEQTRARLAEAEAERQQAADQVESLKAEMAKCSAAHKEQMERKTGVERLLEDKTNELEKRTLEHDRLEVQLEELKAKVEELEEEGSVTADTLVAPLKAEIDKLQDALFTIKLQRDEVEAERNAFENQMEKEKERADAAESKLALAQEQLAAEQAKFDNCLEFEQRAVKAGEDLNRFKEERDTKLAAMQERVNELKAGAIAASEARNLAEVQLFEARTARDAAKVEVAENKAALEAAQEEARKAAEQLQELEREVKLQRVALAFLRAQRNTAESKLRLSMRVRQKLKEKLLECEKRAAGASARTPDQKAQTDAIAQANVDAEVKEAVAEAKQEGDGIDWGGGGGGAPTLDFDQSQADAATDAAQKEKALGKLTERMVGDLVSNEGMDETEAKKKAKTWGESIAGAISGGAKLTTAILKQVPELVTAVGVVAATGYVEWLLTEGYKRVCFAHAGGGMMCTAPYDEDPDVAAAAVVAVVAAAVIAVVVETVAAAVATSVTPSGRNA